MPDSQILDLQLKPNDARKACRHALQETFVLVSWTIEGETDFQIWGVGRYRAVDIVFPFSITLKVLKGGQVSVYLNADTSNLLPLQGLADSILAFERTFLESYDQKSQEEKDKIDRDCFEGIVFLSYARDDYNFADKLRRDIYLCGFEVWLDQDYLEAGETFPREIEKAIEGAQVFVLVISTTALASKWVKRELEYAKKVNKPVLPVIHTDTAFPEWFQTGFGQIETADLTTSKYRRGLNELVDVIRQKSKADNTGEVSAD
jgi:TIR domain